jgi:TonB family protein
MNLFKKVRVAAVALLLAAIVTLSFKISNPISGAVYPGGRAKMERYLKDSLRYPAEEKQAGKEEIVRVTFEITPEGIARNPELTSLFGGSAGFDAEVKRLIDSMPRWEPALDRKGRATSSTEYAIISFRLPDSLLKPLPPDNDSTVCSFAEEMPAFPGGQNAFQTYLQWMVHYPQMEKEQGKDGTVYIYFEVTKTGSVTHVRCLKGVPGAPGLATEAIRVIADMPRWAPGRMKGQPVQVGMTIPIKFTLH